MLKLFTGSANPKLSEEVSQLLKIPLSSSEVVRFENSEIRVSIKEKVKNATCVIIQPTSNPTDTHLMELFFFADALKRNGAKEIIAVIPYFGYARQNREHRPGEAVSANVVIRFLETIGFNAVYTINLHDEGTEGIFSITFKNLSAFNILGREVAHYSKNNKNTEEVAVVSPDQGGVERAQTFAENFFHSNKI
ncbi:MAG: ribose-phosphate diphosphokinase, partial [Candidatus Roizmanbacteria bacterium]